MSPSLSNFLFELANFLLLAAALGWLLFNPVRQALNEEQQRHAQLEEEAQRLRTEAEAALEAAHQEGDRIRKELEDQRRQSLDAARAEASRLVDEARRTQAAERQALERELETLRKSDASALADTLGRIAARSVQQLLATVDGPSLDLALLRAAQHEVAGLPVEARQSAMVETARPLAGEARTLLEKLLGRPFQERVVAELGAGMRLTTAAGQVDATALSVARQAARIVTERGPLEGMEATDG